MAQFKQWFNQDFSQRIEIRRCESIMFTGDDKGTVVGVRLYDNGTAYSGGGTVSGVVKRIDGGLVALTGTLSGNAASVMIPAAALACAGPIGVRIVLNQGGSVTTVLKAIYSVDDNSGAAVDPGTIIPSINDLITAINTAVASIPSDYSALLHILAPDFSASSVYAAGDYAWYNGTLYRFTADHAAGSWTGADTTASVIGNDLCDLKSAVGDVRNNGTVKMLYNGLSVTATAWGGEDNQVYVIRIPIAAGYKCAFDVQISRNVTFYYGLVSGATGKVLWAGSSSMHQGVNHVLIDYAISEQAYLYVDKGINKMPYAAGNTPFNQTTDATAYPVVGDTLPVAETSDKANFIINIYGVKNAEVENVYQRTWEVWAKANDQYYVEEMAMYTGYIRSSDGALQNMVDINWRTTDFIPVAAGDVITGLIVGQDTAVATVAAYDYQYNYISTSSQKSTLNGTYTVPSGVAYVRLSGGAYAYNGTFSYFKISAQKFFQGNPQLKAIFAKDFAAYTYQNLPLKNKVLVLAGDSRSSTDYTFYKTTLQNKTGCTALNEGASGRNAAFNASDTYFASLTSAHDYSIWLVGGNDTGAAGTVGTFSADSPLGQQGESVVTETDISGDYRGSTFIQAVDHIMRKYKALYYDFKTLNNGHIPKMIFCTDLPQKRVDATNAFSIPANWERKRLAILECCEKNDVACLDLFALCNFDMSYEPYWTSPTDKVHDNGLYYMDGLHPNQYGMDVVTSLEYEELKKYVKINKF